MAPLSAAGVSVLVLALSASSAAGLATRWAVTPTAPLEGVTCSTITMPSTLADGGYGAAYDENIVASGGVAPYTYSQTGGTVPAGLQVNADGSVTGTPTQMGTFSVGVTAVDANGCVGSETITFSIVPCAAIGATPTTLPGAVQNHFYSTTLTGTRGTPAYTFSPDGPSSPPPGLSLASDGTVSGTPSVPATSSFGVFVADSQGCSGTVTVSITVVVEPLFVDDFESGDTSAWAP